MPLLERLLRLHRGATPTEDFFTEVVAHLLEADPLLPFAWLGAVGYSASAREQAAVRMATQVTYASILDHATESRPDLVLWIHREGEPPDVVFVESKVGSSEGAEQLARYAEHLAHVRGVGRRTLVYVTRDYDPKEACAVTARAADVDFIQTRWHTFYRTLRIRANTAPSPALHHETLRFMESNGMDQSNRFTPTDALTLAHFRRALSFLDEALRSGPAQRFATLLRGKNKDSASLTQLRDHNRYVVYREYDRAHAYFSVTLGYQFGVEGDDYPELRLQLGAVPTGEVGRAAETALRTLQGQPVAAPHAAPWLTWDLRPGVNWMGAHTGIPLRALLGADDHVAATRAAFDELLGELERVMRAHPRLPWEAPATMESEEGPAH